MNIRAEEVTKGMVMHAIIRRNAGLGFWIRDWSLLVRQDTMYITVLSDFKPHPDHLGHFGTIDTAELGIVKVYPGVHVDKIL